MTENEQKDSWRTPPALFKPLRKAFKFRYDMAASDHNHLLPRYFTNEHSALDADWSELNGWKWCNPPYSDPLPWVTCASRGRKTVMLLNQDTTTKWAKLARQTANLIILLDWRIRFIHAVTGKVGPSNNKCQQLIIFEEVPPNGSAQIEIMSEGELYEYLSRRSQSARRG